MIKTGKPPTSSTNALRSLAFAAITVGGTGTPPAARSCSARILFRLAAIPAAPFSVGTPSIWKWFTTARPYAWTEGAIRGTTTSVRARRLRS